MRGPRFDRPVGLNGYAWWYVDAVSDDGSHALTLIAFLGSVFSPYYAWARRRGPVDPLNHCALNVALYGARTARWSLTERGRASVDRAANALRIGPSNLEWDGTALTVSINEIAVPRLSPIRGTVRLYPSALEQRVVTLDPAGRHRWGPLAPCARVEISFERPALRWFGSAYFDINEGDAPLEADFVHWNWSRSKLPDSTVVFYDVTPRGGPSLSLATRYRDSGGVTDFAPPPTASLPLTRWRVARTTRADAGEPVKVRATLEDAPFYARSVLSTRLFGEPVEAMHESLSLDRFRSAWVQPMLAFRIPRALR